MPRERTLALGIVVLMVGLFGVLIFRDAQAGGKKDLPPSLPSVPPSPKALPDVPSPVFPPLTDKKDSVVLPPAFMREDHLPPPPFAHPPKASPPAIKTSSIWSFSFEMKEGRTYLTAKTGSNEYKVICDSLDLQAPRGQVVAQGFVTVESASLSAKGEKLTISFGEDRLLLEGKAHVQCRALDAGVELTGERFSLRHDEAAKKGPAGKADKE